MKTAALGDRKHTLEYETRERLMRMAKTPQDWFRSLYKLLTTPQYKVFTVRKPTSKLGPKRGYLIDKKSRQLYYTFPTDLHKTNIGADVMAFVMENVPKRGVLMLNTGAGVLVIEYKPVVVFDRQHNAGYDIRLTATAVCSQFSFEGV